MNTTNSHFFSRATLATLLLAWAAATSAQNQPQVVDIPLSRPGDPITLDVNIQSARIEVIGEDRDSASFEIEVIGGKRQIITPSGVQEITNSSFSFDIDEDDNDLSLDADWRATKVNVVARIPRRADIKLHTVNDSELIVRDIVGNLELFNVNGPITASNIAGSVIAQSVNESIDVTFSSIDDVDVSSFESINGDLTVRLPDNVGIEAHMDSARGEITSDFEVDVLPSTGSVQREEGGNRVSVRIESVIVANVNGGGPVLRLKTLNGDIQFREAR